MIVVVSAGSAEVLEPDLLTALAIRSALPPEGLAEAVRRLGLGRVDPDGAHVWLEPEVLHGSAERDADREAALAAMIAFADRHGWVDADGRVRAHVEAGPD